MFYYDGKTMMAFAPAENLVAVAAAPPTIDAALEAAYREHATYFPFTDFIVARSRHCTTAAACGSGPHTAPMESTIGWSPLPEAANLAERPGAKTEP